MSTACIPSDSKEGKCYGGFARIATLVRRAKSETTTIFLNAGDTYQGTAWYNVYKWRAVAVFLNLLKPDVIASIKISFAIKSRAKNGRKIKKKMTHQVLYRQEYNIICKSRFKNGFGASKRKRIRKHTQTGANSVRLFREITLDI